MNPIPTPEQAPAAVTINGHIRLKAFIINVGLHPGAAETDANEWFHQRLHRGAALHHEVANISFATPTQQSACNQ